jgi:FHA domain-containing protein
MEKLLARFKAVFAPSPQAPPPQEVEITPTPPITAPEVAETHRPEPIAAVAERPLAEEPPAMVETPRAIAVEAPILVDEAPTLVDEAPIMADEAPSELEPVAADGLTLRLETDRARSTFQVTKSGATIGRGPESTIQLADLSVSRKHARITYKQGVYWLSDLGSMGGTWIDGTKLAAPRRVATGQTIDIGLCRLVVVAAAEGEKAGAAKGPSNAA